MARQQLTDPIDRGETFPEPDTLEGFSSSRTDKTIYGQEEAEEEFLNSKLSNRLHHAWLVVGPRGIGKATLVYRFTRYLLAEDHERDKLKKTLNIQQGASTSRLVAKLSHPELIVLRRPYDLKTNKLKTEITVDEVRRLKSFLALKKSGSGSKIVIVDPADDLNPNAANALLKSIEEPAQNTYFFLVASNPENILKTIRSRCRVLRCKTLIERELKKAIIQALQLSDPDLSLSMPDGKEWDQLQLIAEGSVGFALKILSLNGLTLYTRLLNLISHMPQCDWKEIHSLADELASQAADIKYQLFFDLLFSLISRLILSVSMDLKAAEEERLAARLITKDQLNQWVQLFETIVKKKNDVDVYNLDRKSLLLTIFQKISSVTTIES